MTTPTHTHESMTHHPDAGPKVIFGFWIFILSDFIMFSALFATYAVLKNNSFGGITIKEIVDLPLALTQTLLILASCLTYGFGLVAMHKGKQQKLLVWLLVSFVLGLSFLTMDYQQLAHLYRAGHTWQDSAFLSAFYTVVGLHMIHFLAALLWLAVITGQVALKGINQRMKNRFACLGLFWDFLNILWIFIFAIVYLMGAV